jgi:cytochrome c oxidase cbb3-type subunit IV
MDAGDWRGVFTLVMFVLFIGICVWAWSGRRKSDFDEAAQLPLEDETQIPDSGSEDR